MRLVPVIIYCDDMDYFGNSYEGRTGGADGRWQSFNDLGMLAIRLRFTDGSSGVFRVRSPAFGDADADLDVDFGDWQLMADCCDEPGAEGCEVFDLDVDGDVDMHDIALFQQLFTGP